MKKILIATRNVDKFRIISKLLSKIFINYSFESLKDINQEIIDKTETGNVINRAKEKAYNVFKNLNNNEYSYIIGIDDSIKIKGKIEENVKLYIKDILFNNYLKENEVVYILRAYSFINKNGIEYSILTEIPFAFQPLKYEFNIKENSYPLSHVLSPMDRNIAVFNMSENESNDYYLHYSLSELEKVKEFFDN